MAVATLENVAKLYVATFNRAPQQAGLEYWVNSGWEIEAIAQSFFDQAETQVLYPAGTTNTALVTAVFQNLFDRDPSSTYWADSLTSGAITRAQMILGIANGATGDEATLLANKTAVGMYYAAAGLTGPEHYSLNGVTTDPATVTAAQQAILLLGDAITPTYTMVAGATSVTEGSAVGFTVTSSVAQSATRTMNYQISGVEVAGGTATPASDLGAVVGTVTILAGQRTGTFTLTPTSDSVIEGFEGFKVSLLNSSFATVATSSNVVIMDGASAGLPFTLTTGVDTFTGNTGNDTFTADNTASTQFGAADTLAGGGGTDSLTIYGTTTTTVAAMTGIENVTVDSMGDGTTWNFGTATGVSTLTNSRAVGASTVTVANGVGVTLTNNAAGAKVQTVNFGATDTAVNLTLNKVSITGANDLVVTGAAATTLNIITTGAASSLAQKIDGDALMTKLVVTGDQNLTIGTTGTAGLEAAIKTVDASAFTANLSVVTGNTAAGTNLTTDAGLTVTGGTGNDTIDVSASDAADNVVVVTGAGTNTVRTLNANLTATEKYTGGAGTDTLLIDFGNNTATQGVDMSALITGFEVLEVTSNATAGQTETLAMATNKLGLSNIVWSGDAGDSLTITGAAANSTLTVKTGAVAIGVALATDTVADTVNVVLDGTTTTGLTTLSAYETVNLTSQKDTAGNTNVLASLTASSATKLVLTGAADLTAATVTLAATAAVDASAYTGNITATTFTAIASYAGGTGKDEITTAAGALKQGVTYAGGAGTDKLTSTATSAQDAGVLAVTGFETIVLGTAGGGGDAYKADFRNVTDLTTLTLNSGDDTDTLTLNRLSADTTVNFNDAFGAVVTTLNTGTSQKVAFAATVTVASLTLDSGATSVSIATADTFTGTLTELAGTSLATVTVTGAGATTITNALGTSVTKVDASAATGALTVTASATATTILGGTAGDTITGGGAADTIQGGKGDDTLSGAAGADIYVFESTAALNGSDTLTVVVADDILNFKNFMSGGSVAQNGGAGAAIVAYAVADNSDVNITNKVALFDTNGAVLASAGLVAEIQATGNAFAITAGGKAIVFTGDASAPANVSNVFFIDDTLDGVSGTISATDVIVVGVTSANFDLDTLTTANFVFA